MSNVFYTADIRIFVLLMCIAIAINAITESVLLIRTCMHARYNIIGVCGEIGNVDRGAYIDFKGLETRVNTNK